jgi:hypothetical protein
MILGVAMVAGGPFVLWWLAGRAADPAAGGVSMPWPAALMYRLGGRWLLAAVVVGVGCVLLRVGVARRTARRPRPPTAGGAGPAVAPDRGADLASP